jgi:AraC family transcriptional regulator
MNQLKLKKCINNANDTTQLVIDLNERELTAKSHQTIVKDAPQNSLFLPNRGYFGEYCEPYLETPEHSHPHYEIVTFHFEEPTPVEFILDGHFQRAEIGHSTTILPAHMPHQAKCDTKNRFSILALDFSKISSIADEDIEGKSIELTPQVSVFDPIVDRFEQLLSLEMNNTQASPLLYIDSLMTALSIHLLKQYRTRSTRLRENFIGLNSHQLRPAIDYIHEHFEENISLQTISQVVGMSQYHFIRCFKQAIGISPYQYLIQRRIERAKQLLRKSQLPLTEIASSCGFANQSHFTTCFKQQTGATPRYFRKSVQQ